MSVMIVTSLGDMVVDLFTDRCPLTSKNFLKLCKIKYYNGCLFHTVQKDFTAQTGDPTGTGSGGDSVYKFLYGDQARFFGDEIHLDIKHSKVGTVAMASAGENLNASQFYITLHDDLDYLDGKHTVFGEIAEGLDTLTRINEAYVDDKSRPYKNIRIKHTYILDDPFDDPPQLVELIPDASPEGKPKDEVDDEVRLEDDWVPMDEQLNPQELEEVLRAKDAHSRAVVLETIGDIPEAEIKPPDNVLFVCKLNPVTEDEDLNTIFSRFGAVTSAEVIRDHKTGDSLCYAFIEFEDKEACEQAYFKMDNALIDDRRIHVDFSQSVAKLWSQYRRRGQTGQGGGCFKCGSVDHIAKDCTGESKQPHSKYILKDNNTQHGGNESARYEMVFGEDDDGGPRHGKKRRDNKAEEQDAKQHSKRHDDRRGNTHDWQRRDERSNDHRQRSPHRGQTTDYPEKNRNDGRKRDAAERRSRDEIRDREHKRRDGNDGDHKHRSDEEIHEKEHKRRRGNDGDHKHRNDDENYEREHKRRYGSDGSYERRNEDRGHEKNHRDDTRHGYERKSEKRHADDVDSRDRKHENEMKKRSGDDSYGHKRRVEELHSDKRSSRGNDSRDRGRKH